MYSLVDLRGFVIRAYSIGKDGEGVYDTESGEVINSAEFGYETFLNKYLKEWVDDMPLEKIIFALEGGNAFRTGMYPEYKANRNKDWTTAKKNEINKAQDLVVEALTKFGFLLAKQEGAEADDLIGYLAYKLEGPKLIHTVDGDLAALAALPEVTVAYHPQGKPIDYITDTFKNTPVRYLTLTKSLLGDSSDNYPGVKGVGPKALDKLITLYGDDILKELDRIVSKRKFEELAETAKDMECKILQKLYDRREEWKLSYQLARIYPNLCNTIVNRKMLKVEWTKNLPDQVFIADLLDEMEDYEGGADWIYELAPEFKLVTADNFLESMDQMRTLLEDTTLIGWDYETWDPIKDPNMQEAFAGRGDFVDVISSKITGCSFAVGKFNNEVFYFSHEHADTNNVSKEQMRTAMALAFDSGIEMVAHNQQFEAAVTLTNFGIETPFWLDTAMFAKNIDEDNPAGLKFLSKEHLNYTQDTYKETIGDKSGMNELTGAHVLHYACDDSTVTAHLLHLFRVLTELEGTRKFIEKEDCGSLALLVDGFVKGVPIDTELLEKYAKEDAIEKTAADKLIRGKLEENCKVVNENYVTSFIQEITPYNRALLRDKGLDKDQVKEGIQKLRDKATDGAVYSELQMVHKEVDFKPTVTQINKVAKTLKLDKEFQSVAAKAITQYMVEIDTLQLKLTAEQVYFLELMTACAGTPMKDRSGSAYEEFRGFCANQLKFDAPPVTVGTELNFGSSIQMQYFLYVMLGLPIRRHTKVTHGSKRDELGLGGGPATNEAAIQLAIAEDCTGDNEWKGEVLRNLIVFNKCDTREKLYWKPYPLWKHPIDGMLHPQINQSATVTHRPTGSSPNLLQVSKKDGGRTRSIFVGGKTDEGEDYLYVSVDFSGQELRIIASETEDPVMLDAYIGDNPKDLHTVTACTIGKSYIAKTEPSFDLNKLVWDGNLIDYNFFSHIRDEEPANEKVLVKLLKLVRGAGKQLNFGVAYGAGPTTVAMGLFIPVEVASELMDKLFARYVRLPLWKEEVWDFAEKHGYVETPYGARRHCWPDIISKDMGTKSRMQRQVVNFKIQGCAADILKLVMRKAKEEQIFSDTGAILLAPIYDELASRVPRSKVVEFINRISACMSVTPPGHQVPMVPEASIGLNWGMQKELGAYPSEDKILQVMEHLYANQK